MEILLLERFSPFLPDPGQLLWTTLIFILFWVIIGRTAFKPIQNALKKRENDIQDALDEAKKAREEMSNLQSRNKELENQAQVERAKILKEAKDAKESILKEARERANVEYKKQLESAKEEIQNQKMAAITDLKNQAGTMAIQIAEQILKRELDNKTEQEKFVNELVEDIKLN
ncbi:MAG: F0F1 ATP synthase subunit B [Bacteroidota bacterium]